MVERGRESILVVDDEAIVLSLVSNMLTGYGYTPILAVDGEHGLQSFMGHRSEIDLVLTDVSMPKLTGPQMAAKIREIDPKVNLIFMTGYSPQVVIPAAFSACATLRKPFTSKRLISAIRECLDSKLKHSLGGLVNKSRRFVIRIVSNAAELKG